MEFNEARVDKGAAALALAEILHVKQGEIIDIGDNVNDIPLIAEVGRGIIHL